MFICIEVICRTADIDFAVGKNRISFFTLFAILILGIQFRASASPEIPLEQYPVSMSTGVTDLRLSIGVLANRAVEVEMSWPSAFSNKLDLFSTQNLLLTGWSIVQADIPTSGANNFTWTDWPSTNGPVRFYQAGNAELDSDGDGLSDAREILMYGSRTDHTDSDHDGLDDSVEIGALPSTDPMNDDRTVPAVTITSPINYLVVMP